MFQKITTKIVFLIINVMLIGLLVISSQSAFSEDALQSTSDNGSTPTPQVPADGDSTVETTAQQNFPNESNEPPEITTFQSDGEDSTDDSPTSAENVPVNPGPFTLDDVQSAHSITGMAYAVDSDNTDHLWAIDLATGSATDIGAVGFGDVEGLAFSPTGVLYGVDDITDQLITIDLTTGAGTIVGSLGVTFTDIGLTFDSTGNLWMSVDSPDPYNFHKLDPTTGAASVIGPMGQRVTGLAALGTTVYGLGGDNSDNLVTIDTTTGAATPVGPLVNVTLSDGGLSFDASGNLWGISDSIPSNIFTIDISTGEATVISTTVQNIESLAIFNPGSTIYLPILLK